MKNRRSMKTPIVAIFCFVVSFPSITCAELSVESYCQVAIGIAQQQTDYLTGLAPIVDKYCEDPNFWAVYVAEPNSFLEEKSVLKEKRDNDRAALLDSYDTTVEELYDFEDENHYYERADSPTGTRFYIRRQKEQG